MNINSLKIKPIILTALSFSLLSACSTTPAPSIYKGGQTPPPVAKVDPSAPVVRPLSSGGIKETPLEAKPLPAKPLTSYAPSVVAPNAPMTPGVDYAQKAVQEQVAAGTTLATQKATQQSDKLISSAAQKVDAQAASGGGQLAQLAQAGQQGAQVAAKGKQVADIALPAASLSGSPAVRELAGSAQKAMGQGDLTGSAATLERALRIEPNNAGLWSRLAEVRLLQGDLSQAEQLALKSSGLPGADAALQSRNQSIVNKARGY